MSVCGKLLKFEKMSMFSGRKMKGAVFLIGGTLAPIPPQSDIFAAVL
jgi:hypothetical protein